MRLTTKTDYCLRVLIYLQENPGKSKIQDIAKEYNISKNHLSVVVNKLSELDYIISTSGPKGGIEFNPLAAKKTIADIVEATEEFNVVECFNPEKNTCNISSHCKLQHILKNSTNVFLKELRKYKISDLV